MPASTRRLAVDLSRRWAADAVERIHGALDEAHPQGVQLRHGSWNRVLDPSTSPDELLVRVRKHHDRLTEKVADVRLLPRVAASSPPTAPPPVPPGGVVGNGLSHRRR